MRSRFALLASYLFVAAACGPGPGPDPDAGDAADARPDAPADAPRDTAPDTPLFCPEACPACNVCVAGECVPVTDGRGCASGICRAGQCCTGCWDGTRCNDGDAQDACGAGGAICHDCDCEGDVCAAGDCVPTRPAASVAAGEGTTCATGMDGRILCWGAASRGTVGHGEIEPIVGSAVDVMEGRAVDVGGTHACAIDAAGAVSCWGANDRGQLGLGEIGMDRSAPVIVSGLSATASLSLGEDYSCAIDEAGKLRCWGAGESGQLGVGGAADTPIPTSVDADASFIEVGAGERHTCAIADTQLLYCWGANETAQLGIWERGITRGRTSPTLVTDATLFSKTTAGSFHSCGRSVLNVLFCWGDNTGAQLGTGDRADRRLPSPIGTGLEAPDVGSVHSCAVRNIGTLACWGIGNDGRLGLGDESDRLEPTLIDSRTTWVEVSAGDRHTCAVDTLGAIYCWGSGAEGQLGVPGVARSLRPIRACLPAL